MKKKENDAKQEGYRLNKFIADTGYCSRRKADEIIFSGGVTVNEKMVREPGYRVKRGEAVTVEGKKLRAVDKCYVLLNKSKDAITTTSDERGRKTVMDLVEGASQDRLYPVGRLDRNTTGLLLLTNDGELANRLSHPSGEARKVYRARLDRPVSYDVIKKIRGGIMLEDGLAKVDEANHEENQSEDIVMLVLHSGKNRVVRRLFEAVGFKVKALDRIGYAGLTLHGLARGQWRYLSHEEVKSLYKKVAPK
jgi:23S rRNA pseudouridine2605 synthase